MNKYLFNEVMDYLERARGVKRPSSLLLDSSLIIQCKNKKYSIKVIKVGEYYQLYYYNKIKLKKDKDLEKIKDSALIDIDYLIKKENYTNDFPKERKIDIKNINRTKFNFQRIVKANENKFKTFITLTFEENIKDVKQANKIFNTWRTNIKAIKKDFLYICVPEFQKRGAVHYHLLTNLDIKENHDIIIPQKGKKSQYDVKYWSYGFSSVYNVKDINVVGYMSKYMTKSCDNRLFGHRRYFCSRGLDYPGERYLDLSNDDDFMFLADLLSHSEVKFENSYLDVFGDKIDFVELKRQVEVSPRDLPKSTS